MNPSKTIIRTCGLINSHANLIRAVISNEAQRSEAQREISPEYVIGDIAAHQEIYPDSNNSNGFGETSSPVSRDFSTTNCNKFELKASDPQAFRKSV